MGINIENLTLGWWDYESLRDLLCCSAVKSTSESQRITCCHHLGIPVPTMGGQSVMERFGDFDTKILGSKSVLLYLITVILV